MGAFGVPSLNSVVGSVSGEAGPTPSPLNWASPIPFSSPASTVAAASNSNPLAAALQNVANLIPAQNTSASSATGTGGVMALAGFSVERWVALILGTVLILIGGAALAFNTGPGKTVINIGKKAAMRGIE